jgi:hypothetical protein
LTLGTPSVFLELKPCYWRGKDVHFLLSFWHLLLNIRPWSAHHKKVMSLRVLSSFNRRPSMALYLKKITSHQLRRPF